MKNNNKGFTLIELLVVIAIIGVLSSVVLASLNTARSKGQDAALESDIDGVRTQAQIYFNTEGSYSTAGALYSTCPTVGTAGTNTLFDDTTIQNQIAAAGTVNSGAGIECNVSADGTAYAVAVALVSVSGSYYCVDNTGSGRVTTNPLGTNTVCQ